MTLSLDILEMSFQGSLFILAVLALRRGMGKRLHNQTFLLLWELCLLRLLLPLSLSSRGSVYSLLQSVLPKSEAAPTAAASAHELVHIRRFDSLLKLLASAAFCLHWFNPLVWVMIACFVLFGTGPVANAAEEARPEPIAETETIVDSDWASIQMTRYSDFTHFDTCFGSDSDGILMGKELWQAGDVITFTLSSEEPITVDVGILEASIPEVNNDYNSYEGFQSQTVTISQEPTEVSLVVPETTLYGIGLEYHVDEEDWETDERLLNDEWLTVSMDINKTFENQLVSEENAH